MDDLREQLHKAIDALTDEQAARLLELWNREQGETKKADNS